MLNISDPISEEQSEEQIDTSFTTNALQYLEHELSVIPVGPNKDPLITWKKYQTERASREQIISWGKLYPKAGIGIVTGKISNLVVVDVDLGGQLHEPIDTVCVQSGGGGYHYYCLHPGVPIKTETNILTHVDIRADGGLIIAPPTMHLSGNRYTWINHLFTYKLAPLPQWVIDSQHTKKEVLPKKESNLLETHEEGSRNDSAARFIGKLLHDLSPELWQTAAWPAVCSWNNHYNSPPLEETELRQVFNSIASRAALNDEKGKSQLTKLLDLVFESDMELYLDSMGEPYCTLPSQPLVGYPIDSSTFNKWLSGKYYQLDEAGIRKETMSLVISTLQGKAFHEAKKVTLYNRIAFVDNVLYYDVGNGQQVIVTNADGWRVETSCPVRFYRFNHQDVQVIPLPGGQVDAVLSYVNLDNPTDQLLFLTYLITVFFPHLARALLLLMGDQGSCKSTALRIALSIIDPSQADLLHLPGNSVELYQIANHHYALYFDNVSVLSSETSDILSRLVTGGGFSKRKLYTDSEDIIFHQKVAVGINGISQFAQKADLLDRSIILTLKRISEDKRQDEEEFWLKFNADKPYILGAIFTAIAEVIKRLPSFKLTKMPRLADYCRYAALAAEVLGRSSDEFIQAFGTNIGRQNSAAIESSPTAQVVLTFMQDKARWEGSSTELYSLLHDLAVAAKLQIGGSEGFPKSASWLWKRIIEIRPNLLDLGIIAGRDETDLNSRIILTRISQGTENAATTASASSGDGNMAALAEDIEILRAEK